MEANTMNDDMYMFHGINFPAKVTEGAISIIESESVRGNKLEPTYAKSVKKGDALAIVGFTEDGYPLVELADGSNGPHVGFADSKPQMDIDPMKDYTAQQAITAGMLRKVGVESTFKDIRPVPVKAGEGITAGDYVTYGADGQKFEKSNAETSMIALSDQDSENRVNIGFK